MSEPTPGTSHRCPRQGCQRVVPNRLFACRTDWYALSKPTRDLIYATAGLPPVHPERREVFRLADEDWGQVDG